jgi:hypothetical protein
MPWAVFALIFKFVAEIVRVLVRKAREAKPQPLCAGLAAANRRDRLAVPVRRVIRNAPVAVG